MRKTADYLCPVNIKKDFRGSITICLTDASKFNHEQVMWLVSQWEVRY